MKPAAARRPAALPRSAFVRVEPGYEVHAHGTVFSGGQTLYLPRRQAERLERFGLVRREIG